MKNWIIAILMMTGTFFVAVENSQAGLYIEPFVGMVTAESEEDDMKGTAFGGRLGLSFAGFAVGGQYTGGALEAKLKDLGVTKDFELSQTGVFVNFDVPVLPIRVWATYILSAKDSIPSLDISGSVGDYEYSGKGSEIGIGFTGLPFVSINVSMFNITYDKVDHPIEGTIGNLDEDTKAKGTMVSISLPFDI